MKKQTYKALVSTVMIILFLCMAFTGALLHFGKTGVVWGIPRGVLSNIHFWAAVLMCVFIVLHFISNFRQYKAELRVLRGKNIGEGDAREGRR